MIDFNITKCVNMVRNRLVYSEVHDGQDSDSCGIAKYRIDSKTTCSVTGLLEDPIFID